MRKVIRSSGPTMIACLLALIGNVAAHAGPAQTVVGATSLEQRFADPPAAARPRVWWHWMNGNISKDGIRKDLEWMKRIGIGGAQTFDANLATPQIVDKRIVYMTPEWTDLFRYAASLTNDLGLEFGIASSPGFSETGGPWVRPSDAMKKLVWSSLLIPGNKRFHGRLPAPPGNSGPFQDMPLGSDINAMLGAAAAGPPPAFYADALVLAYPASGMRIERYRAETGSGSPIDATALNDGDPKTTLKLASSSPGDPGGIVLVYDRPQIVRSATIYVADGRSLFGDTRVDPRLEVEDGAGRWRIVARLPVDSVPTTVSFAPVTGRRFRVILQSVSAASLPIGDTAAGALAPSFGASPPAKTFKVAEFALSSDPVVDRFETKAGFSTVSDYYRLKTDASPQEQGIPPDRVIDITDRMRSDGTLDWTPPQGMWRVVRLGYSLLGTMNHPATAEATGLEVDKYDGRAVRDYLTTYLNKYRDAIGPSPGRVAALVTDSTEVGPSNWTPHIIDQFKRLRGYDPTPWLPTLTGAIVGTRAQSDSFMFDYRRTLADLMAQEHYGTIATVAHERGLRVYGESLEGGRSVLGDDIAMRSHTDVPMAAMWTFSRTAGPKPGYLVDDKGASSVAHLYGQNVAAAESMTSIFAPWAYGPADLRRVIDLEFAQGINLPVVHTSVHQPVDKAPGLSLSVTGQFFNRLESWGELARPWVDYIARSSFLLQQGVNVADVAYFYGEEAPLGGLYGDTPVKDAPVRYAYDFANAEVLSRILHVEHGDLVAKSGARYRVLYLGGSSERMTLPTLRCIADLAGKGATIVGNAPTGSPSLGDDSEAFRTLAATLWSGQPITRVGQGRVIAGHDVERALATIGVAPDFAYGGADDAKLMFVHRRLVDGDAYFVDNRLNRAETVEGRFRVVGRMPELWHADTGTTEPVSYRIEGDETVVPLALGPEESVFVVFRRPATMPALDVPKPSYVPLAMLNRAWTVAFQAGRGAPASIKLSQLASLSAQTDPGIKYFSGIATYSSSFVLPRGIAKRRPLILDLGRVGTIAQVSINGRAVGTAWHAPYRIDIGAAVKPGRNRIEIQVADLWVNRLIGDVQPGAKKVSFTTIPTYRADAPLRPSGLIGPVRIDAAR